MNTGTAILFGRVCWQLGQLDPRAEVPKLRLDSPVQCQRFLSAGLIIVHLSNGESVHHNFDEDGCPDDLANVEVRLVSKIEEALSRNPDCE